MPPPRTTLSPASPPPSAVSRWPDRIERLVRAGDLVAAADVGDTSRTMTMMIRKIEDHARSPMKSSSVHGDRCVGRLASVRLGAGGPRGCRRTGSATIEPGPGDPGHRTVVPAGDVDRRGRAELVGLALRLDEDAAVAAGRDRRPRPKRVAPTRSRVENGFARLGPAEHAEEDDTRSRSRRRPTTVPTIAAWPPCDVEHLGGEQAADAEHRDERRAAAASATRRRCRSRCGARRARRRGCRRRGP